MHEISLATASKRIRIHALNKLAKTAKQPVWEVMAEIERGDRIMKMQFDDLVSEGIEAFFLLVDAGRLSLKNG